MAGGTSVAARACQQNGWQTLVRQDYTAFKNTGDCVSYAARGGLLGVSLPQLVFHNDAEGFYVTVPLTPHVKTTLYGVTDYPRLTRSPMTSPSVPTWPPALDPVRGGRWVLPGERGHGAHRLHLRILT